MRVQLENGRMLELSGRVAVIVAWLVADGDGVNDTPSGGRLILNWGSGPELRAELSRVYPKFVPRG